MEPDRLQEMQEALNALSKVVLKDAHEAIQDLRACIKEARDAQKEILRTLEREAARDVQAWLAPSLDKLMTSVERDMTETVKRASDNMASNITDSIEPFVSTISDMVLDVVRQELKRSGRT
jgi:cellobiose-specific phosphotransferase system component IIA